MEKEIIMHKRFDMASYSIINRESGKEVSSEEIKTLLAYWQLEEKMKQIKEAKIYLEQDLVEAV